MPSSAEPLRRPLADRPRVRHLIAGLAAVVLLAACGNGGTEAGENGTVVASPTVAEDGDSTPPGDGGPAGSSPSANGTIAPDPDEIRCDNGVVAFAVTLPSGWEAVEGDEELRCRLLGPSPLTGYISEEPLFTGYSVWIRSRDVNESAAELVDTLRSGRFGAIGPPSVIDERTTVVAGLPATRLATEAGFVFYVVDVVGPMMLAATSDGTAALDELVGSLFIGALEPSPPTSDPTSSPTTDSCVGGWVTPTPGTSLRTAPLDALRARYGVTGLFVIDEMRYFEGPQDPAIIAPRYDYLRHWYVKASRQDDPTFRARWLLTAPPDREPVVAATAPFASTGFQPGDWVGFFGESDQPFEYPGLPGEYFGIAIDFVTGRMIDTGDPEGPPGLPAENIGCLQGT